MTACASARVAAVLLVIGHALAILYAGRAALRPDITQEIS